MFLSLSKSKIMPKHALEMIAKKKAKNDGIKLESEFKEAKPKKKCC